MTAIIAAVAAAYLVGSIPTAVWVGNLFYKVDIRKKGSGNAGATNTIRVLGLRAGIPVLLFDILKGWFAVYIGNFFPLSPDTFPDNLDLKIILAIAAVAGHIFPLFAGFRGGKGIATLFGVGIALYPLSAAIVLGVFVLVLLSSRYVSLASITASVSFPLVEMLVLGNTHYPSLMILSILVAIFVPITHRKNIQRLIRNEENKFRFGKTKSGNKK